MSSVDAPPHDAPKSPAPSRGVPEPVLSMLWFVRPLAVFAVLAMLLGRAIGPSLRGLAVGLGRSTELLELTGAIASQMFLILATVGTLGLGIVAMRARLPAYVRVGMISAGGVVVLATLSAAASRLPPMSLVLAGAASCLLALVAAWDTMRTPFARVASLMLALVGTSGLLRVAAAALAMREEGAERLVTVARGASTVGFVLDALAMIVAIGYVASQSRKPASPATFLALACALVGTRYAMAGTSDESGAVSVLLARISKVLVLRPEPFVSPMIATFAAFAAPTIALAVLATRTLTPAITAAVALALVARGGPDVPLCALALVLASLSTVLASRDHRGLWAAISRGNEPSGAPTPPPEGGAG